MSSRTRYNVLMAYDDPEFRQEAKAQAERFRKRLLQLRKAKGWTQQRLAEEAGLSLRAVARIEAWASMPARMPSLFMAWKLADALGVSIDELVGRKSPKRDGKGGKR